MRQKFRILASDDRRGTLLETCVHTDDLGAWWLPVAPLTASIIALPKASAHSYAVARQQPAGALRYE